MKIVSVKNFVVFILSVIYVGLFSCKNTTGPCDYIEYKFEAKVVGIQSYETKDNEKLFHIAVQFNNSIFSEKIQNLDELRGLKADADFIRKNHIKIGIIYTGRVNELKSGNCKKYYISYDQPL